MRHPSGRPTLAAAPRLFGRRVMLRPLGTQDFPAWSEVRVRNDDWLTPWEPRRPVPEFDPTTNRNAFNSRCAARDRDAANGLSYGFGLFVTVDGDDRFCGEVNINHVLRGAMQTATIGYWVDRAHAGQGLVAEGVVVVAEFAFEQLLLHRLEICIVPRNHNSRRVMEKLAIREEGVAVRALEINGTWEDHVRYGIDPRGVAPAAQRDDDRVADARPGPVTSRPSRSSP